jgi:hypothetical protein
LFPRQLLPLLKRSVFPLSFFVVNHLHFPFFHPDRWRAFHSPSSRVTPLLFLRFKERFAFILYHTIFKIVKPTVNIRWAIFLLRFIKVCWL